MRPLDVPTAKIGPVVAKQDAGERQCRIVDVRRLKKHISPLPPVRLVSTEGLGRIETPPDSLAERLTLFAATVDVKDCWKVGTDFVTAGGFSKCEVRCCLCFCFRFLPPFSGGWHPFGDAAFPVVRCFFSLPGGAAFSCLFSFTWSCFPSVHWVTLLSSSPALVVSCFSFPLGGAASLHRLFEGDAFHLLHWCCFPSH